jgi:prolyl oligopeptidase
MALASASGSGSTGGDAESSSVLHCRSADGEPVQMIVVRRTDIALPAPMVLSGYGGFGTSYVPHHSPSTEAWVRAGGVYVVANVRGGSERGNGWHEAGRGRRKQNSIDDFVACARAVVDAGLTTPDQLAIWGESNGALLACAALSQAPELFAGAVASSPLCDMVRYEFVGAGPAWRSEYGTVDDPLDFASLMGYSPYHRVVDGGASARPYPATLLTVTEADDRVDGMHARKMCAALQHASDGSGLIAIRREQGFGHSLRSLAGEVALAADSLAFMAAATGLAPPPSSPS